MPKKKNQSHSVCFGTGLIALDLVINNEIDGTPRTWAGGSCGNVLTILSYLGWKSFPVARLGDDAASKVIVNDMTSHGVDFKYALFDKAVNTPIIVQRNMITKEGHPTHRFYWTCPSCGNWLPRYSPIRVKDTSGFSENTSRIDCFYLDRVSPGTLRLAEVARQKGAIIVFEPTGIKDDPDFWKAVSMCHILKYSNERSRISQQSVYESQAKLVVETLGSEGLRYRLQKNEKCSEWKLLPPFSVRNLKDAAGAGDWCTAGLIHMLIKGKTSLEQVSEKKIITALRYGQALSALNCGFEGARGVMYGIKKTNFNKDVQSILRREESCHAVLESFSSGTKDSMHCVCPACEATARTQTRRR